MTSEPIRHVIVVLGMHRSGTSAITRALNVMGVELGGQLTPPVAGQNDKGFWEDRDVLALDEEILSQLGETWDSLDPTLADRLNPEQLGPSRQRGLDLLREKTAAVDWFGMKDPRIVRLLPFWKQLFADLKLDARYVLAVRNPLSVAASLGKRDGFTKEKSLYLWLQHVIPAVQETTGTCRTALDYDRLMAAPAAELRRVASDIGLSARLNESALSQFCEEFLDDGLRHTSFGLRELDQDRSVPRLACQVYETLTRITSGELSMESDEVQRAFAEFAGALALQRQALQLAAALDKSAATLKRAIAERDRQIASLKLAEAERAAAQALNENAIAERKEALLSRDAALARAAAIEASTIWRATAPLRRILTAVPAWLRFTRARRNSPGRR